MAADPWAVVAAHYTPVTREQVFAQLGYVPTPRQWEFHHATEDDVLYGGAAGGGKTKALIMEAVAACLIHAGLTVGVFRRTFPELRGEVLPELRKIGFARKLGAEWNKAIWELSFPNGSLIRCLYADSLDDATKYQSAEFQLMLFLERTLFPPGVCDVLKERIRSGDDAVPVLGTRSGSNPGGPSHGEVKATFVRATNYGARVAEQVVTDADGQEHVETVRFIPAKVQDNPHVDKKYRAKLESIKDPARRAAMLDGNWDVYVGQAFSEWAHERHVVAPFRLPHDWARFQGIDYGQLHPFAAYWGAQDEDGRVWVYRELYEAGLNAPDQARRILAAEAAGLTAGVDSNTGKLSDELPEPAPSRRADPSMWAKRGEYMSIARAYKQAGVHIQPANNDRLNGKATYHAYLAEAAACRMHAEMGWRTCPRLHVFDNCRNLIETLPDLQRDPHRPEDVLKCDTDHAYDASRYLLMGIGGGASFFVIDDDADVDEPRFALHDDLGDFAALPDALGMPVAAPAHGEDSDDGNEWDF